MQREMEFQGRQEYQVLLCISQSNKTRGSILKLNNKTGVPQFSEAGKGEMATQYFQDLFGSSNPDYFDEFFHGFRSRVSSSMNEQLTRDVSKEEVKEAVFAIKPSSAPGHDGMSGLFFQKLDVIGEHVTIEVRNFFSSGTFLLTGITLSCACCQRSLIR